MIGLGIFASSLFVLLLSALFRFFEKQRERKFFLSTGIKERKSLFVRYFNEKQIVLLRMGITLSLYQLVMLLFLIVVLMALFPILFRQPYQLSIFFSIVGFLVFDLGIRWYGNRFYYRFEKGLRTSALPIGIESLTATENTAQAIFDILQLSKDVIIRREFQAIIDVQRSLQVSFEQAMLTRSQALRIPIYEWLAKYTIQIGQFGCKTHEAWQDILDELDDREVLRTMIYSKTTVIRYGVYVFIVVFLIALLLFYNKIAPIMTGTFPFIFALILISVFVGAYRLTQIGGEKL